MKRFNGQSVDYLYNVKGVQVDSGVAEDPNACPVTVIAEKDGVEETFRAKYALVSVQLIDNIISHPIDGAHSCVQAHDDIRYSCASATQASCVSITNAWKCTYT